jgi:hypothetical protein
MALFLALLPRARLPADFRMLATILVSTFGFSEELGRPSDGGREDVQSPAFPHALMQLNGITE